MPEIAGIESQITELQLQSPHDFFYSQFPPSFKWGSTSSATQVEGAYNIDGRKMSWWDTSARKNSHLICDKSVPDISADSYHRFEDDVLLLKTMNATCYKFSLSWSRILPDGTLKSINKAGLDYYDDLINTLLENGIEPIVSLYHWDFPQSLFDKYPKSWADESVLRHFLQYAKLCFQVFGDRVKKFIPIHDSWKHSEKGFGSGIHPPHGIGGSGKVFKNLLRAHASVYRLYEGEFKGRQGGKIGLSVNSTCISESLINCLKVERDNDFALCTERRPSFNPNATPEELSVGDVWTAMKSSPCDFIDLTSDELDSRINPSGGDSHRRNSSPCTTNARKVLNIIKTEMDNIEVLLCGKGCPLIGNEIANLEDLKRADCFKGYANEILKAVMLDGCNVSSFLLGTLIDSWEFENGFTLSYGLHQVKHEHPLKYRIQRASAKYLSKLFKMHGFSRHWDSHSANANGLPSSQRRESA